MNWLQASSNVLLILIYFRVLANYLIWRVVSYMIPYSIDELIDIQQRFHSTLVGSTQIPPRWEKCLIRTKERLPYSIAALYVRKYFNEESKTIVQKLIDDIRNEFYEIIDNLNWMDADTKNHALAKAKNMKASIGYPDELLNDAVINDFYRDVGNTFSCTFYQWTWYIFNRYFHLYRFSKPQSECLFKFSWKFFVSSSSYIFQWNKWYLMVFLTFKWRSSTILNILSWFTIINFLSFDHSVYF